MFNIEEFKIRDMAEIFCNSLAMLCWRTQQTMHANTRLKVHRHTKLTLPVSLRWDISLRQTRDDGAACRTKVSLRTLTGNINFVQWRTVNLVFVCIVCCDSLTLVQ